MIKQLDIAPVRNIKYLKGNKLHKPLQEYQKIATLIIKKHFHNGIIKRVLQNDDALSNITHSVMEADITFDGRGTLEGYRSQYVKWAISNFKKRTLHPKNNSISFEEVATDSKSTIPLYKVDKSTSALYINSKAESRELLREKLEDVIKRAELCPRERDCFRSMYLDGISMQKIADQQDVSRQTVHGNIQRAMAKIVPLIKEDEFFKEYFADVY